VEGLGTQYVTLCSLEWMRNPSVSHLPIASRWGGSFNSHSIALALRV